jgi:hypothetical protein
MAMVPPNIPDSTHQDGVPTQALKDDKGDVDVEDEVLAALKNTTAIEIRKLEMRLAPELTDILPTRSNLEIVLARRPSLISILGNIPSDCDVHRSGMNSTTVGKPLEEMCEGVTDSGAGPIPSVGGSVFDSYTTLKGPSFSSSTGVGGSVFDSCTTLKGLGFSSFTGVGGSVFDSCTVLTKLNHKLFSW